jgi:hypothetical protein
MNIFVTNSCPKLSAIYLDDKRLNKMILETVQILSTALTIKGYTAPYRPTHKNHPCVKWVLESEANFNWLHSHGTELYNEFKYRFGRNHKSGEILKKIDIFETKEKITPFVNCARNKTLGIDYSHIENTLEAYKMYLNDRWKKDKIIPKWTNKI